MRIKTPSKQGKLDTVDSYEYEINKNLSCQRQIFFNERKVRYGQLLFLLKLS